MKRFARTAGLALLIALLPVGVVCAEEPRPAAAAEERSNALTGHYHLEGIMETGSELALTADGRFRWYFIYGALDLQAEGRWHRDGDHVVLEPDVFHFPPQYPETEFKRMQLRIDGEELIPAWPWDDGNERGRYTQ